MIRLLTKITPKYLKPSAKLVISFLVKFQEQPVKDLLG